MMRQRDEARKAAGEHLDCPLVKIYTRAGDDGSTGLLGQGRVPKSDPRVEAFGSVDELNAALGTVRALDAEHWLEAELERAQNDLFTLGAELATNSDQALAALARLSDADVSRLESWIDRLEEGLPALRNFILPSGTPLGAQLHLARTICRRAERRLVALAAAAAIEPRLIRYLNRLGDLLFVMARWCNARAGATETPWQAGSRDS